MFRHLLIGTIEDQFRAGVLNDRNLCIIRRKDPGDAAKVAVCMDVRLDPAGGLHVGDRFRIAVHTAGEAGAKDIRGDRFPGNAVSNSQGDVAQSTSMCLPGFLVIRSVAFLEAV